MSNGGKAAGRPAPQAQARLGGGAPLALLAAGVLAYGTEFGPFGDGSRSQTAAAPAVSNDAMAQVAAMRPGWNPGNSLDAGPDDTSWGRPRTTKAMLDKLRSQGFARADVRGLRRLPHSQAAQRAEHVLPRRRAGGGVAEVCARAGHADLTRAQWRTYVGDVPYQRICGR